MSRLVKSGHPCAGQMLFPETRLYRYPLASFGAAARQDRPAAFSFHPLAKAVRLRAAATVRLERALGHGKS